MGQRRSFAELTTEERATRAVELSMRPAGWQRVLHGDSIELRQVVTEILLKDEGPEVGGRSPEKRSKLAFRYAMCGLGDVVISGESGVSVQPRGCGHRLCPRCGRRRGAKYAKRIIGWLAHQAHGDLWSVVLTQQVRRGETLAA